MPVLVVQVAAVAAPLLVGMIVQLGALVHVTLHVLAHVPLHVQVAVLDVQVLVQVVVDLVVLQHVLKIVNLLQKRRHGHGVVVLYLGHYLTQLLQNGFRF